MPQSAPVVVVASFTAKPESVDMVRAACAKAVEASHGEPGCQLYALHATDRTFVFIEQWADAELLQQHTTAAAVGTLLTETAGHLEGMPEIKILNPVVAGDPAKGRLRS